MDNPLWKDLSTYFVIGTLLLMVVSQLSISLHIVIDELRIVIAKVWRLFR